MMLDTGWGHELRSFWGHAHLLAPARALGNGTGYRKTHALVWSFHPVTWQDATQLLGWKPPTKGVLAGTHCSTASGDTLLPRPGRRRVQPHRAEETGLVTKSNLNATRTSLPCPETSAASAHETAVTRAPADK